MKFVSELSTAIVTTLKELMKNHNNHRARIRAHAVLLSDAGYKMEMIAEILFIAQIDTISRWFNRWEAIGLVGLFDEERSGRPEILTEKEKIDAINFVKDSPRSLRLSLSALCEKVKKTLSIDTLKRILKSVNFSWRRMRKSLKNKRDDKEFEQAKAEIEILKAQHRAGEIDLRFFDETGHDLTPPVPYAWQEKDATLELPSSRSQRVNVLGFMNLDSQLESYVFNCSIAADIVVACFDDFSRKITKPTHVIIDNASIHTAVLFQDKIEEWETQGLFVKFLPPYCPELNLIEILWRFVKYRWLSLGAYKTVETLNNCLDYVLKNVGSKYRITFA